MADSPTGAADRLPTGKMAFIGGLIVVLLLAGAAVWLLVFRGPWPFGDAPVHSVEARSNGSMTLIVGSCNGNPDVERLVETDTEVRVAVSATRYFGSNGACLDTVEAQLEEPLGDRVVFDLVADQRVTDVSSVEGP